MEIINELELANDYKNGMGIRDICKKYKIGDIRAKKIIREHGGEIRKKSSFTKNRKFVVSDWKIEKYPSCEGYHYVAYAKDSDYKTDDYMNQGGFLTTYIKKLGIEIPTLYDRRIYYQETGNYWWEQWFNIVKEKNKETKKCPYCDWETIDIENRSGWFEQHLKNEHGISVSDYLKEHPEDTDYFSKFKTKSEKEKKLEDIKNYVVCPICNCKYEKITVSHIGTHGLTFDEFKEKYPNVKIMSDTMYNQAVDAQVLSNLSTPKNRFISKYEREIRKFLKDNNIECEANRQMLIGKELDIIIPSKKIAIEFNGLKWHTEWFGKKTHRYHLDKTLGCNKHGYGLIHIFEDEYVHKRDIVYSKLSHILGINENLPKIMARKCEVKEIFMAQAKEFLEKNHIQGYAKSSIYLGAIYNGNIVAVMSFKNGSLKNPCWELTRFATDNNFIVQGIGGKLFKYFTRKYEPEKIISFADRRWTISKENNLYTKLGFKLEKETAPDYKYYIDESKNGKKYERIHKMKMSKTALSKKYGFPMSMTETEMAKELGYDRIWDCGLFKYVWLKD